MPPHHPVTLATAGVPEPQTTHVQVTSTIHISAGMPAMKVAQSTSLNHEPIMESHSSITQNTSRLAAPDATGVIFHLYRSPKTTTPSNQSGTPNHGTIIGGILGGFAFLMLYLVIVALCRNKSRYQKRTGPMKGSSQPARHLATNDAINEAHRRRKERNRRDHERRARDSPCLLTTADMAEMFHQGNVMVAEQHARSSLDVVENYLTRPVAVAVPGAHGS
jgi:hypothetical protein